MIYLDYAASSPPFPEVTARICQVSAEAYGNPGSIHQAGANARKILHESRRAIARLANVRPEEVYFTSGGTESNNWAIMLGSRLSGKRHILCSAAEHSSVLEPLRLLRQNGFDVTYLNPDRQGRISPEQVEAALRPDTGLLCVQAVNNETGVQQDVDALAAVASAHRVLYFCDAVQSFGHTGQNIHKADLISLSAHKLGGPRGIGCLIVRQPLNPAPMILGGGQEYGLRSGTENVPGAAGFALAAELAFRTLPEEQQRLQALTELMRTRLSRLCPPAEFAGGDAPRSSILCCRFPGISAEEAVMRLDLKGICASPGAACAARSPKPSHVLLSMGIPPKEAAEYVRFSPGRGTTEEEIRTALEAIEDIYRQKHPRL